ncbi:hypothetical protein [Dokdonella fugitiva]|uniref:Hemin transport protein n=1 Tax=Dokdonella fugitiva TaxID=328517 RepID=A0A4R2IHW8_9GAMM|nr:hypothetical protein [Dokdonella fugitiva]TCO43368.1 hypothetical protein EV148_101792 [Dokdonella fugitiva]
MSSFDDRSDADGCLPHEGPPYAPPAVCTSRGLDLARLADALPKLGTVLWLERRPPAAAPAPGLLPRGVVLLDHPALAVLARCSDVSACEAVTPNGPREWLAFASADGEPRAKLFLLPDSDYLAWDEMTAQCRSVGSRDPASRWSAHAAFLRNALARIAGGWRARLLAFEQRRLPWLRTLDARPPLRISLLGLDLARAIARDEGAELVSPLHAA